MLTVLLERPLLLAMAGIGIVAVCIFLWMQTFSKAALYSAIGFALLTVAGVVCSLKIVTDQERIRQILSEVAEAMERNDRDLITSFIHPNAEQVLQRARQELPQYTFSYARVTRIKSITVNSSTNPATAIAEFNVRVDLQREAMQLRVARFVKVYFMKSDDRWLVRDYEHFDTTAGFRDERR